MEKACPLVEFGGEVAPLAEEVRMGRLHRFGGPAGEEGLLGREQLGQHRLTGQRMTEPKAVVSADDAATISWASTPARSDDSTTSSS